MIPSWVLGAALAGAAPLPPASATSNAGADVAEEADLLFKLGVRDYQAGDLQSALEHMMASERLAPNRNVEFNIARCFEELGMLPEAWRHYDDYVRAEPDPAARAEAENALQRLGEKVARVEITSNPPGATVYVDREDLGPRGVTPLTLALSAGDHPLVLELPGYQRAERDAALVVGQKATASVTLQPVPVEAPVTDEPPPETWSATVRSGSLVVARLGPGTCEILPGQVKGAGEAVEPALPATAPPGTALGAQAPLGGSPSAPGMALDVTWRGPVTRVPLRREDKHSTILADASALRVWVFDRCRPTDPGGLDHALASVPQPARMDAVAVLAEWAAARGATDVAHAALLCNAGDCRALASALVK